MAAKKVSKQTKAGKLRIGGKAPDFTLLDKEGASHSLATFDASLLVLYFYPKDDTPGCTLEAKGFTRLLAKIRALHADVVGISGGDAQSKAKFCRKHRLRGLLLSDPEFRVAKSYGSFGKKAFMGRSYLGILRNTFILDAERRVVRVFEKVDPESHPAEVLAALEEIAAGTAGTEIVAAKRQVLPRTNVKASRRVTRPKKKRPLRELPRRAPKSRR